MTDPAPSDQRAAERSRASRGSELAERSARRGDGRREVAGRRYERARVDNAGAPAAGRAGRLLDQRCAAARAGARFAAARGRGAPGPGAEVQPGRASGALRGGRSGLPQPVRGRLLAAGGACARTGRRRCVRGRHGAVAAADARGVRVGQSDRPDARRPRAQRRLRRRARPPAGLSWPRRAARVLCQRCGHAGAQARRVDRRAGARRGGPGRRLPGRLRRAPCGKPCERFETRRRRAGPCCGRDYRRSATKLPRGVSGEL